MKSRGSVEVYKWLGYSLTISVGVCIIFQDSILSIDPNQANEVLKTLITLYGTLLGFVLTLMSIVISLSDKDIVKNMNKSGHYLNLLTSSKVLSFLYFCSLAVFIVTLMVNELKPQFYLVSIFATLLVAVYSLRTAYKFFQVFKHIDPGT